ncbi:quinone oxidoreductase family protein [Mangrovitalea sediminis]|uniref:quinone oxidoreductase family protein n=1 Tax=Mangrovitalea sediminis TaxID=1982043 RepID=UPI000BE6238B|nr:zinc-binding alcohol dehydrogenase family protein [Mangrovitalea sediminis]
MKALQFAKTGDLNELQLVEVARPALRPGEVLVEIRAAGLNPSDVKNVLGRFPYTTLPRIPGRDFAGVVVEGTTSLLGREVWGTGKELGFTRDGSHAEYLALPAEGVALKPPGVSFAQAASCGVPYTTAWDALERCRVGAGSRVVILGANGAVGKAAVALARWRGAQVIGAVRRAEEQDVLERQGIPALKLDRADDFAGQVRGHFPGGADMVFDTTGFWVAASVAALAPFGRLAIIAAPADGLAQVPVLDLYRRGGEIVGVNSLLYDSRACARMLERIGGAFDAGQLPLPATPATCPLEEGLAAYHRVNDGDSRKQVLVP